MNNQLWLVDGDILLHKDGSYYRVLHANAKQSETSENVVVYQSLKTKEIWVRPLEMFTKDRFTIAIKVEQL